MKYDDSTNAKRKLQDGFLVANLNKRDAGENNQEFIAIHR